jgi:hypothetical protein
MFVHRQSIFSAQLLFIYISRSYAFEFFFVTISRFPNNVAMIWIELETVFAVWDCSWICLTSKLAHVSRLEPCRLKDAWFVRLFVLCCCRNVCRSSGLWVRETNSRVIVFVVLVINLIVLSRMGANPSILCVIEIYCFSNVFQIWNSNLSCFSVQRKRSKEIIWFGWSRLKSGSRWW